MSINKAFAWPSFADLVSEAKTWGMAAPRAAEVIDELIAGVRNALINCNHLAVTKLVSTQLNALKISRVSARRE